MTIAAEEGALRSGAEAVQTASDSISQHCKTVRGEIEQMRSYWSGPAAIGFSAMMQSWDTEVDKLTKILNELHEALGTTEKTQAATEEEFQSTIAHLNSHMKAV